MYPEALTRELIGQHKSARVEMKTVPTTGRVWGSDVWCVCVSRKRELFELWGYHSIKGSWGLHKPLEPPEITTPYFSHLQFVLWVIYGLPWHSLSCQIKSLQFDLPFTWESVLWSFTTCTVLCRELPCASPLGPPVAAGFKPWTYPTPEIRYPMAETPAWGVNSNEKVTQVFKEDTTTSFGGWGSLSAPSLGLCLSGFPGSAYRGKLLLGKRGFISLLLRHRYKHPISPHHLAPSSWHDASDQHRYTCSIWACLRYLCLLYLFSGIKVVVDK